VDDELQATPDVKTAGNRTPANSPDTGESARTRARRGIRDAVALVAALIVFLSLSAGLVGFTVPLQVGVLVGVSAGLLAGGVADSALIGLGAVLLGVALKTNPDMALASTLVWATAAVATGAAAGTAWWLRAGRGKGRSAIALVAIALVLTNFWATALTMDLRSRSGQPTAIDYLSQVPAAGEVLTDNLFYQRVMWMVDGGMDYYQAFRQAYNENPTWGHDPNSVVSYRFPTVFWLWKALPGKPLGMVLGIVVLSSVAILSGVWIVAERVHVALAVPVAALLAGYFLNPSTTNGMLDTEAWAIPFGLLAVALTVSSYVRQPTRRWLVGGVVAAVVATLMRETMAYLILAGLCAAIFAPAEERRLRASWWVAGAAAVAVAFGLHAYAIGDAVSHGQTAAVWLNGGPRTLWLGLTYATTYLAAAWVVPMCAVLALVGTATVEERGLRAYGLAVALFAILMVSVFGNDAVTEVASEGSRINYWGMVCAPVLIALAGWAPGAARTIGWTRPRVGNPES